jgi:hypothetical protein
MGLAALLERVSGRGLRDIDHRRDSRHQRSLCQLARSKSRSATLNASRSHSSFQQRKNPPEPQRMGLQPCRCRNWLIRLRPRRTAARPSYTPAISAPFWIIFPRIRTPRQTQRTK